MSLKFTGAVFCRSDALPDAKQKRYVTESFDKKLTLCLSLCDFRAADEYIVRYFSKSEIGANCKVLRVYYKERRPSTVSPDVRKYCLMKDGLFVDPCRQDILQNQIILTTMVTSLQLTALDLQDCFTHILIDEAAQVRPPFVTKQKLRCIKD